MFDSKINSDKFKKIIQKLMRFHVKSWINYLQDYNP